MRPLGAGCAAKAAEALAESCTNSPCLWSPWRVHEVSCLGALGKRDGMEDASWRGTSAQRCWSRATAQWRGVCQVVCSWRTRGGWSVVWHLQEHLSPRKGKWHIGGRLSRAAARGIGLSVCPVQMVEIRLQNRTGGRWDTHGVSGGVSVRRSRSSQID